MTSVALAATLFGPEDLRMIERPLEALGAGMVRIRFGAGGICGSDMHYFRHARTGDFVVTSPLVLGHEISGEVVEINGTAPGLRVGDRVAVNPSRWCGHCVACREGRPNLCENIFFMGSASKTPHMQGGFANYFDAIPAQCVKIPDHVSYQAAALAEPLSVCLHAVTRAGNIEGKRGIIFCAPRRPRRHHGRRHRVRAARLCEPARRRSCRERFGRRGRVEGAGRGAPL